jgi:hypothetical protein
LSFGVAAHRLINDFVTQLAEYLSLKQDVVGSLPTEVTNFMIRCEQCNKNIINETKEDSWFRLMNLLNFLNLQGAITDELYESAVNDLMDFKRFAMQERWEMEERAERYQQQQIEHDK